MELGTSTVDITPPVGLDLSGYLACTQPSIGVHDPLFVRGLYVKGDAGKLLWLHADLIGFHREFVLELKGRIGSELGIGADKIVVSAEPFSVLADECGRKLIDPFTLSDTPMAPWATLRRKPPMVKAVTRLNLLLYTIMACRFVAASSSDCGIGPLNSCVPWNDAGECRVPQVSKREEDVRTL